MLHSNTESWQDYLRHHSEKKFLSLYAKRNFILKALLQVKWHLLWSLKTPDVYPVLSHDLVKGSKLGLYCYTMANILKTDRLPWLHRVQALNSSIAGQTQPAALFHSACANLQRTIMKRLIHIQHYHTKPARSRIHTRPVTPRSRRLTSQRLKRCFKWMVGKTCVWKPFRNALSVI